MDIQNNIIFFDFDGVIRCDPDNTGAFSFDYQRIHQLVFAAQHCQASIVVTSDWRKTYSREQIVKEISHPPLTDRFPDDIWCVPGNVEKAPAVMAWLTMVVAAGRVGPDCRFVIVDDQPQLFPGWETPLVVCNNRKGFQLPQVGEVVLKLTGRELEITGPGEASDGW